LIPAIGTHSLAAVFVLLDGACFGDIAKGKHIELKIVDSPQTNQ
jgi:hypothetical protein